MTRAVTAHVLKSQLGRVLRELKQKQRFVIFRRNRPVGILLNLEDYLRQCPGQYEGLQDFVDTFVEESDPRFQRSLRRAARSIRTGTYLTHRQLKLALGQNKLR